MIDISPKVKRIGFMQGRLSPLVNGKIQAFPWDDWEKEFSLAKDLDLTKMEWTLDQEDLYKNPLLFEEGQKKILELCKRFNIEIPSITGDCFMQSPYWKAKGNIREALKKDFIAILKACASLGIKIIVVPLVDQGRIENKNQSEVLLSFLEEISIFLHEHDIKVVFESDLGPEPLADFISGLDKEMFGINYDIGNSASLGFNPVEEFRCYGERIINVHIKDRPLGGTTVPLGLGDVNFPKVFELLEQYSYQGNYIMQTARGAPDEHSRVLGVYQDQVKRWLSKSCAT